ncbi:MAG: hypothetical protein IIA72_23220 [Proteobacteria bacterium]|nr:hypothetical protein [Pseudomonadota bacterium]
MDKNAIIGAVTGVTKKWAKQRKAEERHANAEANRRSVMTSLDRFTIRDAADDVMEEAYLKASSGGTLPAHARQIMYAARGPIQDATGQQLNDQYFCQTLLPDYMRDYPEETADWNVVFDARGHFHEPHTDHVVPLGTLDVRAYLGSVREPTLDMPGVTLPEVSTHGPSHRYGAILFIEKEGFMPLFREVQLAERHDISVMSTKGMHVTAARALVDTLCGDHDIPLLVLHDFDKAGFSIIGTFRRNTRRYKFKNKIEVIDLGLRLEDIEKYDLEPEEVYYRASTLKVRLNLIENGATEAEVDFLIKQRVELNAFASADLIEWIEDKLAEYGVEKVLPSDDQAAGAYRQAVQCEYLSEHSEKLLKAARAHAKAAAIPDNLKERIAETLQESPAMSWDTALHEIVEDEHGSGDGAGGEQ